MASRRCSAWRIGSNGEVSRVSVSANRDLERYRIAGLTAVPDRTPDLGPIGGLDALAQACTHAVAAHRSRRPRFRQRLPVAYAGQRGRAGREHRRRRRSAALVALWHVEALRTPSLATDRRCKSLQHDLAMPRIRLHGVRFGNLNTPDDLVRGPGTLP
jgi:molybdopterin-guanine dinucleotide biosynthesis protein A